MSARNRLFVLAIIVIFAPRESKRDDADIRDAIHRIALSDRFCWLSPDRRAIEARRTCRQLQAGKRRLMRAR